MIKEITPLSMTESLGYIGDNKDSDSEIKKFVKKFIKLKPGKAKELREKIEGLDLMKVRPEYVAKIIDLLPEEAESLNKIFTDVSLDEDETKKILEITKEFI